MTLQETLRSFDSKYTEVWNSKHSSFIPIPQGIKDNMLKDIIQSHIDMWEVEKREMEELMEKYSTTYGTDKHNGQTEHWVELLNKRIEEARNLLANE